MSYRQDTETLALLGEQKVAAASRLGAAAVIGAVQAGAYVGVAIIVIMTLGAQLPDGWRTLVMGGSFGLALILVKFAGAELFSGYHLYSSLALLQGRCRWPAVIAANLHIFCANLMGAALLVGLYWVAEGALLSAQGAEFLQAVAAKKMSLSAPVLLARGALCNWLVCLALWMAIRVRSEAAQCICIAWCLLAFIVAGFEHSVANMSVHLLALAGPHNPLISLSGAAHNLLWVSLGNIIGGAVFVGYGYHLQSPAKP